MPRDDTGFFVFALYEEKIEREHDLPLPPMLLL